MTRIGKITTVLAATAVLGGIGAPAFAGGMAAPIVEAAPQVAPTPVSYAPNGDWTGGHIGAQLGYGRAKSGGASDNGSLYGLRAGYDHDFGKWVLGANIDWNKDNMNLTATDKLDQMSHIGLRAGMDMGRTLVYVTGGAARAKVENAVGSTSDNGYYGGIGADYAVNDRWTVGGELLSHHFDNFGGGSSLNATTAALNVGFRF